MKKTFVVFPGKRGSGLETSLEIFLILRKMGFPAELYISSDNERLEIIKKSIPEAKEIDFSSPRSLWNFRSKSKGHIVFFSMISPKLIPLFLLLDSKKIFYFHSNFDYSLERFSVFYFFVNLAQDFLIRHCDEVAVTQAPLAWQIKFRYGKIAKVVQHPLYNNLRRAYPAKIAPIKLPFEDYFLIFGDLNRYSKGAEVMLFALRKNRDLHGVFAGKCEFLKLNQDDKNILHFNQWLPDENLNYLVKKCKAVVLPYLTSSQFSGCAALAYLFKKPIIASFSNSFEKYLENGKTGLFFTQGDADDLAAKMRLIKENKIRFKAPNFSKMEKEADDLAAKSLYRLLSRYVVT